MKLEKILIENYRNLDGINVHFNLESNYIVGENNIGKSNFLDLIHMISNSGNFIESDFVNTSLPIIISLTLRLNESEVSVFGEQRSRPDASIINIKVIQNRKDAHPQILNVDTFENIPPKNLKKINFLKYDTGIYSKFKLRFADNLLEHINTYLMKIKVFHEFGISTTKAVPDSTDMLSRYVYFMDENRLPVNDTGSGIQFMAMAALNTFSKIMDLYQNKSIPFEETLFITKEGKKILPLILSIDEPEVHLHPYMQRAMLNYYKRILKNDDSSFLELLKYSFDIDGLDGQLIIVTHSTDALVDNHRNIVRFYRKMDGRTNAISGVDMNIRRDVEKHLLMHFPDVKEAFYAKCVLIVEGETEYGCIRGFSKTLNISMDDYGICFVNAHGEGSINKLKQLFDHFGIPSVVIFDSDVKEGKIVGKNDFFTKEVCFEMDIIDKLIQMKRFDLIKEIALELDSNAYKHLFEEDFVKKPFKKINYDLDLYTPMTLEDLNIGQIEEYQAVYFAWFYVKKGILIGRIIGETLTEDCIPTCYVDAISKAKEVALL